MNTPTLKELDESVYYMLDLIRKRPGMFIVEPSIIRLHAFINGYSAGLLRAGYSLRDARQLSLFHDWVAQRLGFFESTSGWVNMIRDKSTSDADAFWRFYALLDEYRKAAV